MKLRCFEMATSLDFSLVEYIFPIYVFPFLVPVENCDFHPKDAQSEMGNFTLSRFLSDSPEKEDRMRRNTNMDNCVWNLISHLDSLATEEAVMQKT